MNTNGRSSFEYHEIATMHNLSIKKYTKQDLSRTMMHAQAPTKALAWKVV